MSKDWFRVRERDEGQEPGDPGEDAGDARKRSKAPLPAPDTAWTLVGWTAFALALVGAVDVVLAWYPLNFGDPQWEFGTISRSLDSLPLVSLGVLLLLGSAVARGQRWLVRTAAVFCFVLAAAVLAADVLYATNVPIALRSVPEEPVRLGMKKAIAKATVQGLAYPAVFIVAAVIAVRKIGRTRRR